MEVRSLHYKGVISQSSHSLTHTIINNRRTHLSRCNSMRNKFTGLLATHSEEMKEAETNQLLKQNNKIIKNRNNNFVLLICK